MNQPPGVAAPLTGAFSLAGDSTSTQKSPPLHQAKGGRVGAETVSACFHFIKVACYGIMHKLLNRHSVTACGIFNHGVFFLRECNRDFYHGISVVYVFFMIGVIWVKVQAKRE